MASLRLADVAVNLTDAVFRGVVRGRHAHPDDLALVVRRARSVGVERIVITGTSREDSREAWMLARSMHLNSTVGCHPTRCSEIDLYHGGPDAYFADMLALVNQDRAESHSPIDAPDSDAHEDPDANTTQKPSGNSIVAIGECGLDYARTEFCPKDTQQRYFERHFDLAQATGLPLFLHCRDAAQALADAVRRNRSKFTNAVVHSFDGSTSDMRTFTDNLGLYIGINGCSMKTKENIDTIAQIPLDRLILETDAPWCDIRPSHASYPFLNSQRLPDPISQAGIETRKKERFELGHMVKGRNEPCTIRHVLRVVAAVRGEDESDVAAAVWTNTMKLFYPNET